MRSVKENGLAGGELARNRSRQQRGVRKISILIIANGARHNTRRSHIRSLEPKQRTCTRGIREKIQTTIILSHYFTSIACATSTGKFKRQGSTFPRRQCTAMGRGCKIAGDKVVSSKREVTFYSVPPTDTTKARADPGLSLRTLVKRQHQAEIRTFRGRTADARSRRLLPSPGSSQSVPDDQNRGASQQIGQEGSGLGAGAPGRWHVTKRDERVAASLPDKTCYII